MLNGTAATGKPVVGVVDIYGSQGGSLPNIPIDNSTGQYSADVSGLTPPYLIVARPDDDNLPLLFSFADGPGIANITPLTTLVLFIANDEIDPETLINDWQSMATVIGNKIEAAQKVVNANLLNVDFSNLDPRLATIDFSTYDLFTTEFSIGDVFDSLLELIDIDFSGNTAILYVNGNDINFNPDIDTSDITIGGAQGSLNVSGNDTQTIGTVFTPTLSVTASEDPAFTVTWTNIETDATLSVALMNGNLFGINYVISTMEQGDGEVIRKIYSYNLDCFANNNQEDCGKVNVDSGNKTVTFNGVRLNPFNSNLVEQFGFQDAASAPIILDGTLSYTDSENVIN